MSLSRAFTMRRNRGGSNSDSNSAIPSRSLTTKHSFASGTVRSKISGPIELISTTNMLSYNAPDIFPKSSPALSTGSRSSTEDDGSDRSNSSVSSPITEASSIGSSSPRAGSPDPNHLSCYFGQHKEFPMEEAPVIPKRALSHTKKNAEILARKRSTSRMSSPKNSISTRSSLNMFSSSVDAPDAHPFGNELAQVTELAEDYGISQQTLDIVDEEEQELVSKGLFKFRAEDYMSEIQGLFASAFGESKPAMAAMWI
ncbi:hypothetical protein GLAREA_00358 [Glarea lozoyensis ATCC 20868]|uniref:Uncharacterized protein n=1 Tax=Glarea lozoyensis (strain ATCC 20868 / MF5171) TaxID=1116229 RepID=S3DRX1_GLAL2|nr:uncharacterized protein GLAREA_00358 [Glarea lozoyensis ATCC 20868]EPE29198.1 hypothetical protein GLAREA_00358 [Glarea lozoyensis ATCC 20868]